jgi:nucleoside phosphorylase
MAVDHAWLERNLGYDPTTTAPPVSTFAFQAAAKPNRQPDDLQRDIIDFDSEGTEGAALFAFSKATGLSQRFTDIPWPKGLEPKTGQTPSGSPNSKLPEADVLVVTWTVDEGHALSRVLTPGKDSRNDYRPYKRNYATITRGMSRGAPAVKSKRLGAYWTTTIGRKKVLVLKSESHLSQDTHKSFPKSGILPNALFWKQIIEDVKPKLVISTGTGGGIGKQFKVGDVVVSSVVRFDSQKWLKKASFAQGHYSNGAARTKYFAQAKHLFDANAAQLPHDGKQRPKPKIVTVPANALSKSIVTTDFFGFDTSANVYNLRQPDVGDLCEMGDAVLGMVANGMSSAIVCWALIAAL